MYKIIFSISVITAVLFGGIVFYDFIKMDEQINPDNSFLSPISKKAKEIVNSQINIPNTELADPQINNILLLGIDRRSKQESSYRTDIMILVTIDKLNNKILLTSIPRDLWYKNGRINALYIQEGWPELQIAFEQITGQKPTKYVLTDFEDFSWIVDAVGGVEIDVQTSFTDTQYPVDATLGYQTVQFTQGKEVMTGERALIFSRSRKGDFDNGDWGRMKRQHLLLEGFMDSITQPKSFVCMIARKNVIKNESCENEINTEVIKQALHTVTTGKMETNFSVEDLTYLWDFYKQKDEYEINSLIMDYEYLEVPNSADYGGAWVLTPIGGNYNNFHNVLEQKLKGNIQEEASLN